MMTALIVVGVGVMALAWCVCSDAAQREFWAEQLEVERQRRAVIDAAWARYYRERDDPLSEDELILVMRASSERPGPQTISEVRR